MQTAPQGKDDRHIYHMMSDCVRRLHQDIEGLWRSHVRRWQPGPGAETRDISAQLDPRAWHHNKCAEFLEAVYGDDIPLDGVPGQYPWNGRRAALGHLLGWLTGARDRPGASSTEQEEIGRRRARRSTTRRRWARE